MSSFVPVRKWGPDRAAGHPQAGLSFVEVMVTLFIIALTASLIVFSVPRPAAQPEAAIRLQTLLERASLRARTTGTPTGLMLGDAAYELTDWRGGAWQPVAGSRVELGPRVQVALVPSRLRKADEPDGWPVVVFDPLGHTAPVDLVVTDRGKTQYLSVQLGGGISLERPDA